MLDAFNTQVKMMLKANMVNEINGELAEIETANCLTKTVEQPFVDLLYGKGYSGAYQVLAILLLGIIGMVFYKMVYSYNVINQHKLANLVMLGIAALANILANAILIPGYGIAGAAVASTVSYVICGICFLIFFCRKTGMPMLHMLLIRKEDFKLLKKLFSGK